MATQSPSPSNSTPDNPSNSTTAPPPQPSSITSPPPSSNSSSPPIPQPNATPPSNSSIPTSSPPASPPSDPAAPPPATATSPPPPVESPPPSEESPPPATVTSPPPSGESSPPPPPTSAPPPLPSASPPPTQPITSPPPSTDAPPPLSPVSSPPPPAGLSPPVSAPPPPPGSAPPPQSPPPPPGSAPPPQSSPPPPGSAVPPSKSPPPPPQSDAPTGSPPPSANPPLNSPPSTTPPADSPPSPPSTPPPSSESPTSSPSPPTSGPPPSSPPPPATPQTSPSPPAADAPKSSPSPPAATSPQTSTPPPANSSLITHPPPPPDSNVQPTPSDSNTTTNNPSSGAPESSVVTGHNGLGTGGAVGIGLVVGVLVLGLIGIAIWCLYKRKRKTSQRNGGYIMPSSYTSTPLSGSNLIVKTVPGYQPVSSSGSGALTPSDQSGFNHSRSWFTYQELSDATNGFSTENLLGEGGFGPVYKGNLPDGREVAVKQLKAGGGQGEREFKAEVEIISRVHHRHLVSLVGYCIHESRRLLVYDYVPNDTLHHHLHGDGVPPIAWANRVRIAAGAARGIAYLHEDCHPRIIHRDIKSSNILLDNNFHAQVADFGLARLALDVDTHISTRVMGTFGYLAPEYATSGKLTDKSDVYSYGVVLLELITGRKPVDASQPLGDESLVEWARPLLSDALKTGNVESLVDPKLEKNYTLTEMQTMIKAAAFCTRHSAIRRPRMGQVARSLDFIDPSADLSNGMDIGASQVCNSSQQSAQLRMLREMAFGSQDYPIDSSNESSRNSVFSGHEGQNSRFAPQPSGSFSNQHAQNANFPSISNQNIDISNISSQSQSNQNIGVSGSVTQSTYSSSPNSCSTDSPGDALFGQGGEGAQDSSRNI